MTTNKKKIKEYNFGEYFEDDFSSREAMAREIERDFIRVTEAKEEQKKEIKGKIEKMELTGHFPDGYYQGYKDGKNEAIDDILRVLEEL